jgi:hypothetical protein
MFDHSRAIADSEDIVVSDGLQGISDFDEVMLVAREHRCAAIGGKVDRRCACRPDDEIGGEVLEVTLSVGRIYGIDGRYERSPIVDSYDAATG